MLKRLVAMAAAAAPLAMLTLSATPAYAFSNQYHVRAVINPSGPYSLCLDIPNNHAVVGAQLDAQPCDNTADQESWNVIYTDSYHFELQSWTDGNLCANNWQGGDVTGNNIKLYNCNGDDDSLWNTVSYGSNQQIQIQPKSAVNTCLNIWGGLYAGGQARLFQCADVPNEDVSIPGTNISA